MKIALVILHADPARGGAERYTIDLAAALARLGHDVSLLAASFATDPPGVHAVELDAGGLSRAGRYRRWLDSLDRHLAQTRYDIVHAMLPVRQCDVYHPHAGIAAEMTHATDALLRPRRREMAEVERQLLLRDDRPIVLCLSEYIKGFVRKHYPLPDERLATLFNAVDLARFEPAGTPRRTARVNALFVGHDFQRKGLMQTLAAMSALKDDRLELTVVGKLDPKFHHPPHADTRVHFAGEAEDIRRFYRDADFFVLPTRHDPCSLVVLEALAMGLPVISTRFNGACEIMTDGVHGFVLDDPDNVLALTEAMRQLLDPERRARMSRACLALRDDLSYEKHLQTLLSIYARCRHA